ncbi:septum formation initiator family protein [Rhodobacteraceae bacterium 2376]|uniref:Septum formation initiator family protein n=1 Tax=Rhabdonatronobacter sediminivivens TaxID=2743469 RepID=A0A7Z0L0A8_9RHOB|nr:septum formation initiator family protein [Rhabdonatronobacter sediminivivens]NYS25133.1 septum formation initiator family protein [Rhabdonatronobacter sediminivivens]
MKRNRSAFVVALHVTALVVMGGYFGFAAVQGDYGLFNRIQIEAENVTLRSKRDALQQELAQYQNRTRRLSEDYLDIELLDQQARQVLGLMHPSEIVIR